MESYLFKTDQFAISEKGIHLLRNEFNYQTFLFREIVSLKFVQGKEIKNWLILLLIGIVFLGLAAYLFANLYVKLVSDSYERIYIEEFVVPVLPLMLGGLSLYSGLKNGLLLKVETSERKEYQLSLVKIVKQGQLASMKAFLSERSDVKLKDFDLD